MAPTVYKDCQDCIKRMLDKCEEELIKVEGVCQESKMRLERFFKSKVIRVNLRVFQVYTVVAKKNASLNFLQISQQWKIGSL